MENIQNSLKTIFSHNEQLFYMSMHYQSYEIIIIGISIDVEWIFLFFYTNQFLPNLNGVTFK
jgi:hypothetical protein